MSRISDEEVLWYIETYRSDESLQALQPFVLRMLQDLRAARVASKVPLLLRAERNKYKAEAAKYKDALEQIANGRADGWDVYDCESVAEEALKDV